MGTLTRTSFGLVVAGLSLAALLAAGGQLYQAYQNAGSSGPVRTPKERVYSVAVGTLTTEILTPVIQSFGHLSSGRTLELRSSVAGALVEISPNFANGGEVAEGDILFRIDPTRLETALRLAEIDLQEAHADLAESEAAFELTRLETEAAQTQLTLREQALARQEDLRTRGVATDAQVEAAVLAVAAAQQTLISRKQAAAASDARVAQAAISVERRDLALAQARTALDEAIVTAPFAGVLTGVNATLGRLVSPNEKLGELIDPTRIEVAFRVTNTQFRRLQNDQGTLRKADVTLTLQSGRNQTQVPARIDRADAEVGTGQVGRVVYATLIDPDTSKVRPGDFVSVQIPERPLSGVAKIPAAAATPDGKILLIGDGDRLEEVQVTLLRQQGDDLIVADVPEGRQYVLGRAVQLGVGIQVDPVDADTATQTTAPAAPPPPATIVLDDARRAALIAFVESNEAMKPDSKAKVLAELAKPEVSLEIVEKFEARMADQ